MSDRLIIGGKEYAVINAWNEVESSDGRKRWGIVTDETRVPVEGPKALSTWVDGSHLELSIEGPDGKLYQALLPATVLVSRMVGNNEILRFVWELTDPEDGTVQRGAARLVLQEVDYPQAGTRTAETREERQRRLTRLHGPIHPDPDEHLVPHSSGPAIHVNRCAGPDCIGHDE